MADIEVLAKGIDSVLRKNVCEHISLSSYGRLYCFEKSVCRVNGKRLCLAHVPTVHLDEVKMLLLVAEKGGADGSV